MALPSSVPEVVTRRQQCFPKSLKSHEGAVGHRSCCRSKPALLLLPRSLASLILTVLLYAIRSDHSPPTHTLHLYTFMLPYATAIATRYANTGREPPLPAWMPYPASLHKPILFSLLPERYHIGKLQPRPAAPSSINAKIPLP